ncbi:aldose epimerase [Paenibacillus pinisoli]|uniref:Aldose epimerase n=1 Tax=Paenibacillus pinisoli TaxID=1276110 RepID=A0A3A6PTQ8_9BACL|nr:aldose epimerase [Paenibacillus pinisoli]RJX40081.1 aldose epimerase [Paenibacillus pinisoli]
MSTFEVSHYQDTYTIYELKENSTSSRVLVCPERGAIVIGCQLNGEELFFLDKATFENPATNIRGGNPILFPIAGSLKDAEYQWNGVTYKMGQHGVARLLPWEVVSTSTEGEASITLRLRSSEATLAAYPFQFELIFTYALVNGELHTRQQYRNIGQNEEMPFYSGFHPYFAIEGSKDIPYQTDAPRYVDLTTGEEADYTGRANMDDYIDSICLFGAKDPSISFPIREGVTVNLRYDDLFKYVVIWSVKERPFVCVEPWMGLPNEMNNRKELIYVKPGEELRADFIIGCETK